MAAVATHGPAAESEIAYLWPCNVQAWCVWCELQTQWRHSGMGDATGLDYAGVRAHLDECGHSGSERKELWSCIQAAERATLDAWAERASKKQQDQQQ
ncbi:MAG: DUF1799 domain-containing protein [Rhodoferax sp.]